MNKSLHEPLNNYSITRTSFNTGSLNFPSAFDEALSSPDFTYL